MLFKWFMQQWRHFASKNNRNIDWSIDRITNKTWVDSSFNQFLYQNYNANKNHPIFVLATVKCHCSHCSSTQFLCETDGLCFLSWRKINDEFVYTQSCYDKKLFFPPDAPDFCEIRNFEDYGRMCCKKDYCNIEEFREEAKFNMYALIFFVAFLLSIVFLIYQNWN